MRTNAMQRLASAAEKERHDDSIESQQQMSNRCRNCGSRINKEIARVVGDNDDCVPECRFCTDRVANGDNNSRVSTVSAATKYRRDLTPALGVGRGGEP